ncbi:MAG: OmpA family protein, partial [Elusimicrobiota bacterium]|nr:OmpA family protein [Elusimicrobiota bacterium]
YNKKLSYMRANSVKAYLVKEGIHPTDIKTYGFGQERPIVRDTSDKARALNRRVEFRISTRNWESVY